MTLTAGIDMAAQAPRTGAVIIDWTADPPMITHAATHATDQQLVDLCRQVADRKGLVGIDCPLGWPRAFVAFVSAHAAKQPLPAAELTTETLRLRATDVEVWHGPFGRVPLSVSTNLLGITALRTARLLAQLRDDGHQVDRSGVEGLVCEVYPVASRAAWGLSLAHRDAQEILDQLHLNAEPAHAALLSANEHVFDALIAALSARAVACHATDGPPAALEELAREEGWIHVPRVGHQLAQLASRTPS